VLRNMQREREGEIDSTTEDCAEKALVGLRQAKEKVEAMEKVLEKL
jgi:hypothetical protein